MFECGPETLVTVTAAEVVRTQDSQGRPANVAEPRRATILNDDQ